MNQFQKSYSLKNFLWWQSVRSNTLHLDFPGSNAVTAKRKSWKIMIKKFKNMKICNGKHECQFKLTLAEYGLKYADITPVYKKI